MLLPAPFLLSVPVQGKAYPSAVCRPKKSAPARADAEEPQEKEPVHSKIGEVPRVLTSLAVILYFKNC